MISVTHRGSFSNLEKFLARMKRQELFSSLDSFGERGVAALANATPKDTSETANSWRYRIVQRKGRYTIEWYNTHMAGTTPVVILIQYGHGTGTGGYVEGRDFINPAIRPIFDQLADDVWKKVTA